MLARYKSRLRAKATGISIGLESRLDRIMQAWLLLAGLASVARISISPLQGPADVATFAPYILLILAPFASMVFAMRWFAQGDGLSQPSTRLARVGRWRDVNLDQAKAHHLFGAGGIMVSLMLGILFNVPVRALEYLVSMPALAGPLPEWLWTLNFLMTLDVVLFTSLYTVAFVAALRRVPLFPRLLAAIWIGDITMQAVISQIVAATPSLPANVATGLHALLDGNMQKVMISVLIWLPYLLISKRVNVTYRHRVARTEVSDSL